MATEWHARRYAEGGETVWIRRGFSLPVGASAASEPTVVSCKFEHLPPMLLTFRGGMGANDNTLQVGQAPPVALSVGSSLMVAEIGAQELTFSLRMPASVSYQHRTMIPLPTTAIASAGYNRGRSDMTVWRILDCASVISSRSKKKNKRPEEPAH